MPSNLQQWEQRLQQMKECRSITDLVRQFGEASHKVPEDGFEIWHYPLGADSGNLYSIHVSVWPDQSSQIYMHMEPTKVPDAPRQYPSWMFWRRRA